MGEQTEINIVDLFEIEMDAQRIQRPGASEDQHMMMAGYLELYYWIRSRVLTRTDLRVLEVLVYESRASQEAALNAAGCDVIRVEKASGTSRVGRPELELLLGFMRKGDELVVTRVDRLARSIGDLQDIVRGLKAKGVALRATEQPIDTATAAGKCFLDMLGVFAEFETNLRRERQLEGIAKAKAAGVYKGGKPWIDVAEVKRLTALGRSKTEIAEELDISRMSVYRVLKPRRLP
jgi:DNA invertase Pin-like site-specific DNA recombinase